MRTALLVLVAASLLTGCSDAPTARSGAAIPRATGETGAQQGDRSPAQLRSMLLQAEDLPSMTNRREFASSSDLTTQATPQLALCTAGAPVAPHELANVLAKPDQLGHAQVFEVLSYFLTGGEARRAFDVAAAAAARCGSYELAGTSFRVVDIGRPQIPRADAVLQYRLTTPDVINGDVRTLAVSGRSLVLLTGFGAPPPGKTLLGYQAEVMSTALRRLGA